MARSTLPGRPQRWMVTDASASQNPAYRPTPRHRPRFSLPVRNSPDGRPLRVLGHLPREVQQEALLQGERVRDARASMRFRLQEVWAPILHPLAATRQNSGTHPKRTFHTDFARPTHAEN